MTEPFGYEDIMRRIDEEVPTLCHNCLYYESSGICTKYLDVLRYIFTADRLPGSLRPTVSPEDVCEQWTANIRHEE